MANGKNGAISGVVLHRVCVASRSLLVVLSSSRARMVIIVIVLCIVVVLSYVYVWMQLQRGAESSMGMLDLSVSLDRNALQTINNARVERTDHVPASYSRYVSLFVIHEDTQQ